MKIMITGGYDESTADSDDGRVIIEFAKRLAEQVILQKHQLRCGNLSSLDALVINAACDAAEEKEMEEAERIGRSRSKGEGAASAPKSPGKGKAG